jgi:AcrR family transcriptional regulator
MDTTVRTTKQRLLESACEVFAEKGFRNATVADICEAAGANIASVNYHFGDKEHLYEAVWRHAFSQAALGHPVPAGLSSLPPEDRLKVLIHTFVARVLDPGAGGHYARIQVREMIDPTPALDHIVRDVVIPQRKFLLEVVDQLLGGQAPAATVHLCTYSIASQCMFLGVSDPVRHILVQKQEFEKTSQQEIADHITEVALAVIRRFRKSDV